MDSELGMSKAKGDSATSTDTGIRQDPTGNLRAPTLDIASPLSSDPQFVFSDLPDAVSVIDHRLSLVSDFIGHM